jgi:hypothetical protein
MRTRHGLSRFAIALLAALNLWVASARAEPNLTEIAQAEDVLRLQMKRDRLLSTNRRWQVPAVGIGVAAVFIATGAALFVRSWSAGPKHYADEPPADDDFDIGANRYNLPRWATGIGLITGGAVLAVVSAPMLTVRLARSKRCDTLGRELRSRGVELSVVPQFKAREHAGLSARLRF